VRSFLSSFLTLAVLTAFAEAPFLHTHQHAATQQHPGPFLHLHLKTAHSVGTGREFRGLDPNEDAQYQNWFSTTCPDSGSIAPAIPAERFALAAPELIRQPTEAPLKIGHDPPLLDPQSPRGPPA
jgi:hypothetical protein